MITLCNLPVRLMMTAMRGGWLVWIGAAVAVAALAGLGFYVARVGLEQADQLASVLGLVVAAAGLGITVSGLVAARRRGRRRGRGSGGSGRPAGGVWQEADASGRAEMVQAGRDVTESPAARPGPAGHDAEEADAVAAATDADADAADTGDVSDMGNGDDTGDGGDGDDAGGEPGVVRQRATAVEDGRVYQAGRDFTEGPARRSGPDSPDAETGAAGDDGDAGGEAREVRQQARASGNGRVYQAGRDINKR
ncbi:hypothetical protein [Herbidospora cretacea]|uniref:hypothetical protein n=1 Tax=Herbidospora cretacea TaxID=28444 RepID=UPI0006906A3D|nr:hypothetical protein [Herbidospora cretacea]